MSRRRRVMILPPLDGTRERDVERRRGLIASVKLHDCSVARGFPPSESAVAVVADHMHFIRAVERKWGIPAWDRDLAMAVATKGEVREAHEPAELLVPLLRAATKRTRIIVRDGGQTLSIVATGVRYPLRAILVANDASPTDFYEAMAHGDATAGDDGHDLGGVLLTASGQVSTAAPVGQDAYLVFCRKCLRGAWYHSPLLGQARAWQLGGVCAAARLPSPPAAAPGQLETHAERGPNRSGSPSTRTEEGPPVGPQR